MVRKKFKLKQKSLGTEVENDLKIINIVCLQTREKG